MSYTHEQKEKLARRISKIKNKQKLIDILKIIQKDPSYNGITENNNGIFLLFHKMTNDTYSKIEKYIKKNIINCTSEEPMTESHLNLTDDFSAVNDFDLDHQSKFKYSNKEKCIIKRKLYDNALNDMIKEGKDVDD